MRRGRPLGLTIALWATTLLYGVYPLALSLFYLVFALRRNGAGMDVRAWVQLVTSVILLVLVIPAWLGRPPSIRVILAAAVLVLLVLNVGFALADLASQPQGLIADSTTGARQVGDTCSIPIYVLLTAYVVWYLNRYPSRAYYNGARRE